jgi:coenzyme PQQ synthesis protein D (PqqD)
LPDVLSQEVSGETILLDLKGECYFGLDNVGTRIFQLLKEHGDLKKVYDTMMKEFDVEEDQLEKDLHELVVKLVEAELVEIS